MREDEIFYMPVSVKDILIEILTIAGYPNNKEIFATEFESLNILETMTHVYDSLSKENQDQIKANINDPDALQRFIPQEIYRSEFIKITREALTECIQDMLPALTPNQKERINKLAVIW